MQLILMLLCQNLLHKHCNKCTFI